MTTGAPVLVETTESAHMGRLTRLVRSYLLEAAQRMVRGLRVMLPAGVTADDLADDAARAVEEMAGALGRAATEKTDGMLQDMCERMVRAADPPKTAAPGVVAFALCVDMASVRVLPDTSDAARAAAAKAAAPMPAVTAEAELHWYECGH